MAKHSDFGWIERRNCITLVLSLPTEYEFKSSIYCINNFSSCNQPCRKFNILRSLYEEVEDRARKKCVPLLLWKARLDHY